MTANSWTADGIAASLMGKQPRGQPGASETYTFQFNPSVDPEVGSVRERYEAVASRWEHASTLTIKTDFDDEVVYSSTRTDLDHLVALEPVTDPLGRGIWGLITGGSDEVEVVDDGEQEVAASIDLEVSYIAPLGKYENKAAVRSVHEERGFH